MSEYSEEFKEMFASLADAREEAATIETWLEEQHPAEMERLRDLKKRVPVLVEKLKEEIRSYGQSGAYLGYNFTVQHKSKMKVDEAELLERAQERGEMGLLLDVGLLKYAVIPQQLERLDGELRAVYGSFIQKEAMTPAVSLPKDLTE